MIEVEGLHKRYPGASVLADVDLTVAAGEIVALLGPSGCGKTTLLRVIAGLELPDAGRVRLAGEPVSEGGRNLVPPERRGVGLVFQDFALFPHLSVRANVAFGLKGQPAEAREARVTDLLARFDLAELGERRPAALSGGQQQRVALARALAPAPRVLLLDEPFSNLDAALRRRLRVDLRARLKAIGVTTVLVTHDESEALSLADQVAVMEAGRIAQIAPPDAIYSRPETLAVARATGPVNAVPGEALAGWLRSPIGDLRGTGPDGPATAMLRPEQLVLGADSGRDGARARLVARDYTGAELELWLAVDGLAEPLVVRAAGSNAGLAEAAIGDTVRVQVRGAVLWCARAGS